MWALRADVSKVVGYSNISKSFGERQHKRYSKEKKKHMMHEEAHWE